MGIVQFGGSSAVFQDLTDNKATFMTSLVDMKQRTKKCETHTNQGLIDTKQTLDAEKLLSTNYRAAI
eukprot:gene5920-7936_t